LSDHPGRYLADNWLNVAVLAGSAASMLGASTEWFALVRLARVAIVSLVMLRAVGQFRVLFTRHGAPKLVGVTVLVLAMTGALLYWLEPTITNYWDGVWLAFVTATTIGYGDFVATTASARLVSVFVSVIGFALVALFTANVVARFIGRDASDALRGLHDDIAKLREDVGQLIRDGERVRSESPKAEFDALRRDVAEIATRLTALSEQLSAIEARADADAEDRFEQRQTVNRSR
jgi:voltage-gated potassium channel